MAWLQQTWSSYFGHLQPLLHTTLLLLLFSSPSESLFWDAASSDAPSQGCDGLHEDVCGVCAGDGSSCKLIKGTVSHSDLTVGYHKILDLPRGAQRIKIRESLKTINYLALRTHTGESVINGAWVTDRPGRFHAAGTVFTYKRPNEIRSRSGESITAPGPTNQELHFYILFQQQNITVHYEYVLPKDSESGGNSDTQNPLGLLSMGNNGAVAHSNQMPSNPVTPEPFQPYIWVATTTTPCSTTCGAGKRQVLFSCVEQATKTTVTEDLCSHTHSPDPHEEDCQTQLCPAFWDIGEWSECSKMCGPGFQHRQVLCRQTQGRHANSTVIVAVELCDHTEMPETTAMCQLKICSQWQIRSEWTLCSVPCGVGQRSREVVCVDNLGDVVSDEECNLSLRPQDLENCDMGACAQSWFYTHWSDRCSADCGEGSRSRSVVCLSSQISSLPLDDCDDAKPEDVALCNLGPCTHRTEWYTGPWGQCSSECGNGTQSRGVICMLHSNGEWEVLSDTNCSHLPRPPVSQPCHLKNCGPQWYTTDWSSCSRSCEGGYRVREVRCLGDDLNPSDGCDPTMTPVRRQECNMHVCVTETDESCRDIYFNCVLVVQSRLCVYSYYRTVCCVSCSRSSHRNTFRTFRAP